MAERSRIMKVAGWSLVGFCAVSAAANKLPVGINTVQVAGFCGAFLGALAGRYRKRTRKSAEPVSVASAEEKVDGSSESTEPVSTGSSSRT
jgi:hypothetical protein